MVFHSTPQTINALKTNENKKLEAAIDTMRDLPVFGDNEYKVDYRWPKVSDLLRMPTDKPIQVAKLRWKKNSCETKYFGGI